MAIYRSSDSLSRCDPNLYSSPFDLKKRTDIKHEPIAATQPIHKDTIQISRDKLKEEALNRLRHTSTHVIAQNSFMRVGKYLFLAVAFPPYFILYGLPKWVLVEGLPAIFSMCVWMLNKVQNHTQKHVEAGKQKIIQTMQFVKNVAQFLIQPIVHLALEIRQGIRRLREQTLQVFKTIIGRTKQTLNLPLKMTEGGKRLRKRMSQIREKWSQQAQTLTASMQVGIQWIKESPQLFLGWGQGQLQRLNQQAVSWGTQCKVHFKNCDQHAVRAIDWVYKQFKDGLEGFKSKFYPVTNFFRHQVQPHLQHLKIICKRKWGQTRDFFHQKHQKALAFLQGKQKKLKQLSSLRFIQYLMMHPWLGKLPLLLQNWLKKAISNPAFRALCEAVIKTYSFIAGCFLRSAILGLQFLSKGTVLTGQSCNRFGKSVKIMSIKALDLLEIGGRVFRKSILKSLYYFLLFVMISFILFVRGIHLLRNCMGLVTARFSKYRRAFKN